MMPHVLDDQSKMSLSIAYSPKIIYQNSTGYDMMIKNPDDTDRVNTGDYLKQFSSRRSIESRFPT